MDINKLIKESHEMAVKKGFWDCPNCIKGQVDDWTDDDYEPETYICPECDGTNINKNANIPEKLMLIVSELGEAQEALRKNHFANWNEYDDRNNHSIPLTQEKINAHFALCIKDTFEDEIADVYIRLADLCGYLHFYICPEVFLRPYTFKEKNQNISSKLFEICGLIYYFSNMYRVNAMLEIFNALNTLCSQLNIDIEKHITAKMAYNATRPYKHGKAF